MVRGRGAMEKMMKGAEHDGTDWPWQLAVPLLHALHACTTQNVLLPDTDI